MGRARWGDLVICLVDLYERTGKTWLVEFCHEVAAQGLDWVKLAEDFPHLSHVSEGRLLQFQDEAGGLWMNDDFLSSHGVNVAMALRAFPAMFRLTSDETYRHAFDRLLAQVDDSHGLANGMFSCDEHLAGRSPSQGSETCAVVEFLQSLEYAYQTWGPASGLSERIERVAFNALPAASNADDTAHQYVQQPNQVICHVTEARPYTNNGPDANVFGLEQHFGCCTANRHQGWPRFATPVVGTSGRRPALRTQPGARHSDHRR